MLIISKEIGWQGEPSCEWRLHTTNRDEAIAVFDRIRLETAPHRQVTLYSVAGRRIREGRGVKTGAAGI